MELQWKLEGGGVVRCEQRGTRLAFFAWCGMDLSALYKVWLEGTGGTFLLGTLIPRGERLELNRILNQDKLVRMGCWPVRSVRRQTAFRFDRQAEEWVPLTPGEVKTADPVLSRCLEGDRGMLFHRNGKEIRLAWAVREDCPLPLAPLFCLAVPEMVQGRLSLVWKLDEAGQPVCPVGKAQNEEDPRPENGEMVH